ncbi:bifunctional phosphopantothenoylcysteine decarboxylase/phosphopantothenate--cysteine ligase CoaBC [Frigoribacterium sp. VKM Ac-2836]|uniref:bifunctional phosphopantothenoylcysteine decarboxylase/phosphopantothenate--cysteine ligase CoaBC n=1 Tax=Frigoribacterium sp. VKM Ac-2836 TaxID=2739014 RepID=UPI0015632C8C|nr:bifunctional phosphopantothenoylcysteine decarboxylase/phosphopantothenate--cysteine ligase CoaBC [Frigoribacterium sp. VKM Ac-2836]NRD25928.1 bifunctional phosphopantothenoylcysteine decarboxylase/phosphopantothenate--cysteine ligase CoaBC [Frigoribacterium sp. VKM Ac-2836]
MSVVVGVSGGIAAYKAVAVVRGLVRRGHDVHVIPTEAALRFVGAPTWEATSRNSVHTSVFDDVAEVRHVALGQRADLIVVAPATAHTLAKIAHGLSDDLLGTTILASTAPLVVAPAMHTEMWRNPATVANVELLRSRGVTVVGPDDGQLTGGDVGPGRLSEPDDIVAVALARVAEPATVSGSPAGVPGGPDQEARVGDLQGLRLVVSVGGTREPLDPVRFIGNRSSGHQGASLALGAARRGARVTVVAAALDGAVRQTLDSDARIEVVDVSTALDLETAMAERAPEADVVVMAAAVADYRPATVADGKIRKDDSGDEMTVRLVRTPDVLAGLVARRPAGQVVVGFAAETAGDRAELLSLGRAKQRRKGADLLVLNSVGWTTGFGSDDTAVVVIDVHGDVVSEAEGSKAAVSETVLDALAFRLAARREPGGGSSAPTLTDESTEAGA